MDIFVAAGQMLVLFAMMFTGYFLARRDWINDSLSSALSRLVVNIFNPFFDDFECFRPEFKTKRPFILGKSGSCRHFLPASFPRRIFYRICPPTNESKGPDLQTADIASELRFYGHSDCQFAAWLTVHYLRRRLHARV